MRTITEQDIFRLVAYVKTNYGVDLTRKKSLVVGRLQNYIARNNFDSFSAYIRHVLADQSGAAANVLVNKLTTNHTFFMREPEHFTYLHDVVLPYLVKKESSHKDLRIWSAGCSTGEEAYTLAMTITDFFGAEKKSWDTKILATDISTQVLEKAVTGIYADDKLQLLPETWRRKYFEPIDQEKSVVKEGIKKEVIFRRFNLMEKEFPFKKKFHVIFCRNVMLYFDAKTQTELVNRFYEWIEAGGYLFIGHSETLNLKTTKFRYLGPAIYRKE
jgi:chemotaxis protein methyltransferase CheR